MLMFTLYWNENKNNRGIKSKKKPIVVILEDDVTEMDDLW